MGFEPTSPSRAWFLRPVRQPFASPACGVIGEIRTLASSVAAGVLCLDCSSDRSLPDEGSKLLFPDAPGVRGARGPKCASTAHRTDRCQTRGRTSTSWFRARCAACYTIRHRRKVKESNPRPFGRPSFRDWLDAVVCHLPYGRDSSRPGRGTARTRTLLTGVGGASPPMLRSRRFSPIVDLEGLEPSSTGLQGRGLSCSATGPPLRWEDSNLQPPPQQ